MKKRTLRSSQNINKYYRERKEKKSLKFFFLPLFKKDKTNSEGYIFFSFSKPIFFN